MCPAELMHASLLVCCAILTSCLHIKEADQHALLFTGYVYVEFETISGVFSAVHTNSTQSMSQLEGQSTTPQIILAAGAQNSGALPLQQLLIPVSAGTSVSSGTGGIQQLISVPVPVGAAAATGQMQLLTTPGGQLINVANTPHLNVAMPSTGM